MPVRMRKITRGKNKGKFNVVDTSGKKLNKRPLSRERARRMVTAVNISLGYVPGLKPRRRRKK